MLGYVIPSDYDFRYQYNPLQHVFSRSMGMSTKFESQSWLLRGQISVGTPDQISQPPETIETLSARLGLSGKMPETPQPGEEKRWGWNSSPSIRER